MSTLRTVALARVVSKVSLALVLGSLPLSSGCARNDSHRSFDSAGAAVAALATALEKDDKAGLQKLLGPGSEDLLSSGDAVQDHNDRAAFLVDYGTSHTLVADDGDSMTLVVGEQQWPFPIPVVKRDGRWYLDGDKGAAELIYRRVGANELGAISVCRGFVGAEHEYASAGRDGDAAGIYALKLISDQGLHNGLYWPSGEGEEPSPAGPFVAAAASEGYRSGAAQPYHGYEYRILYRQGPNANGGAREYFRNGVMTNGFGLVAWPRSTRSAA
jgi:DUF2950 family protein